MPKVAWFIKTDSIGVEIFKTLRNVDECIRRAHQNKIDSIGYIYAEDVDDETSSAINRYLDKHRSATALNLTRTVNIEGADYVAYIKGGDLVTNNFLQVIDYSRSNKSQFVAYTPCHAIVFEHSHGLYNISQSADSDFTVDPLIMTDVYTQAVVVKSAAWSNLVQEIRDVDCLVANCVAGGGIVVTVKNTIAFRRIGIHTIPVASSWESNNLIGRLSDWWRHTAQIDKDQHGTPVVLPQKKRATKLTRLLVKHELLSNYIHSQIHIHKEIIRTVYRRMHPPVDRLYTPTGRDRLLATGLTPLAIEEWAKMNTIEPMIRASHDMIEYMPILQNQKRYQVLHHYANIRRAVDTRQVTDIVLVPHLVRGGADLTAINLVKALCKKPNRQVLVIATVPVASPWRELIEDIPNVKFFDVYKNLTGIDQNEILTLVLWCVKTWHVPHLSVINSEVGYRIAAEYSKYLQGLNTKLYLHTYAYDMTDDGYLYNVIYNGLVNAYPGVDSFITDSKVFADQLVQINGFSENKVTTLYQPIESSIREKKDYRKKNRILWASRIGDAKLVEVMVKIGRELSKMDVELHVYGALDENYIVNDRFNLMIKDTPTIHYHGSYEGFGSIDVNQYDMFLMTTKNEGMPNVILEACMANIFIIAPQVGGIIECIKDRSNGLIVLDYSNPEDYVSKIFEAYKNEYFSREESMRKVNTKIKNRHSQEKYQESVNIIF